MNGGLLGAVPRGQLYPEPEAVAFAAYVRIPSPPTVDDRVWRSDTPVAGLTHCPAALGIGANSIGTQL